nr:MAG TPA: SITE SPECIFIC RECOMBINASE XERD [Caudoviricetes sp.]
MDATRQKILSEYISYLYQRNLTYDKCGRYIMHVASFLEHAKTISRAGYLKYKKKSIGSIKDDHIGTMAEAICDFLSFKGIGYKAAAQTFKPLQKLSSISDRNRALLNDFLNYITTERDYSPNTIAIYRFSISSFFKYATEYNAENVRRFIQTLSEENKKPSTIRLRITALEQFGKHIRKPIEIRRPKIPKSLSTDNIPTEAEYVKLLDYLQKFTDRKYYWWVRILATSGVRLSEFMRLTWEDVINGEVLIYGKGNKYRRVFFPKDVSTGVAQYVKKEDRLNAVYCNSKGRPIGSRNLREYLQKWGAACGISSNKMHPHAFRHLFAKLFLKKKNDIVQLADMLGHASIDTTRIYLQRSYAEQKRDFNRSVTW